MKRKNAKAAKKAQKKPRKNQAAPRPRNPHARALRESGLLRPKVVPTAKSGVYRRKAKHPKAITPAEDD